jgi:hypothetical protein
VLQRSLNRLGADCRGHIGGGFRRGVECSRHPRRGTQALRFHEQGFLAAALVGLTLLGVVSGCCSHAIAADIAAGKEAAEA